jgi:hypothetical protein
MAGLCPARLCNRLEMQINEFRIVGECLRQNNECPVMNIERPMMRLKITSTEIPDNLLSKFPGKLENIV